MVGCRYLATGVHVARDGGLVAFHDAGLTGRRAQLSASTGSWPATSACCVTSLRG